MVAQSKEHQNGAVDVELENPAASTNGHDKALVSAGTAPRGFLKRLSQAYDQQMVARPLITKTWTSFVLSTLSTLIGQILEKRGIRWGEAIKFGIVYCPPYSHYWYIYMDKWLGEGKHAILKTVLDQAIWQPLMLLKIFFFNGIWNGLSREEMKYTLRTAWKGAVIDGWKVWPAIQFINMKFIPAVYQSSILDVVCFFWDIYLSIMEARGRQVSRGPH